MVPCEKAQMIAIWMVCRSNKSTTSSRVGVPERLMEATIHSLLLQGGQLRNG